MDAQLTLSPMRANLQFELKVLTGESRKSSHKNIMDAAVNSIKEKAPNGRCIVFMMYKNQVDEAAECLRVAFPDRTVVEYDEDRRPDLSNLDATAIIVSTSALKTGTNLPETNLVVLYGCAYHLEDWLQAAGRAGRCEGSQVRLVQSYSFAPNNTPSGPCNNAGHQVFVGFCPALCPKRR